MSIRLPISGTPSDTDTEWGPTTKKQFCKFTSTTPMAEVRTSVIEQLVDWAIEKPDNNATGIIITDSYGKATIATAGTDYMSPSTNATLAVGKTINLGNTGSIGGNGIASFVNVTVADTTTTSNLVVNTTATIANATITKLSSTDGIFASTDGNSAVITVKQGNTTKGQIFANGAASFGELNVANLKVNGSIYQAFTTGTANPTSSTDRTKLYINTSTGILFYPTGTNTWTALGAVFK